MRCFPMPDHEVPTFTQFVDFTVDARAWLDADAENVISVHCKGGKGRTGTMICALLLCTGYCSSALEALRHFESRRTVGAVGRSKGRNAPRRRQGQGGVQGGVQPPSSFPRNGSNDVRDIVGGIGGGDGGGGDCGRGGGGEGRGGGKRSSKFGGNKGININVDGNTGGRDNALAINVLSLPPSPRGGGGEYHPDKHSQGVTGPSQIRFVRYFAKNVPRHPQLPPPRRLFLAALRIWHLPPCTPYCVVHRPNQYKLHDGGGRRPTLLARPTEHNSHHGGLAYIRNRAQRNTTTKRGGGGGGGDGGLEGKHFTMGERTGVIHRVASSPSHVSRGGTREKKVMASDDEDGGREATEGNRPSLLSPSGEEKMEEQREKWEKKREEKRERREKEEKKEAHDEGECVTLEVVLEDGGAAIVEGEFKVEVRSRTSFGTMTMTMKIML